MGIINKGILGPVSGKVGTVIGGSWKGIPFLRSLPTSTHTNFTIPQLEQQAKFSTTIKFLQPMSSLLSVSFRDYAVKMTGFNNAMGYTLKNAITGTYPAYTVDYSMALVSRGDLPNATAPQANSTVPGKVSFTWGNNAGMGKALPTDYSILVVYCPEMKQCIYTLSGPERSVEAAELDVPLFQDKLVETYLGFITTDGKDISNSYYTGDMTVTPIP